MSFNILLAEWRENWPEILSNKLREALKGINQSEGHITCVSTFKDALNLLQQQSWDLLVTDVSMNPTNKSKELMGMQLIEDAFNKDIPTIAITGSERVNPYYSNKILVDLKASYLFYKPTFEGEAFIKKVQELLKEEPPPISPLLNDDSSSSYSIYGIQINHKRYIINRLAELATHCGFDERQFFSNLVTKLDLPERWEQRIINIWNGNAQNDASTLINWILQRKDYPKGAKKPGYTPLGSLLEQLIEESADDSLLEIIIQYKLITDNTKIEELRNLSS